jgi:hypothetical protein
MLVVASSKIASSRRRHLVVICLGMFGQDKLLPQNVRDIIRDIVRDMNKLLPQKLVLLLYLK